MDKQTSHTAGFTLVEVLVSLAVTGLVMTGIYGVYLSSLQSSMEQEAVVGMQQDQRFALDYLTQNLRMAGYDPEETTDPAIEVATATFLYFTQDWQGKGTVPDEGDGSLNDAEEHVAFCLYSSGGEQHLGYTAGSVTDTGHTAGSVHGHQPIISNVENLEFLYRLADGTTTLAPALLDDIRSVTISLLVHADTPDPKYSSGRTFTSASGTVWGPFSDTLRRRFIQTSVNFRNLGL